MLKNGVFSKILLGVKRMKVICIFIEKKCCTATIKLIPWFINLLFSKFYLEIDNESPGQVVLGLGGKWYVRLCKITICH
jgi:hypothetical protein